MESAALGLSRDSASVASEAVTRSRSPPRLPSYGLRTSSTVSPRLPRLWGQRSTSPTPWGGVQRRWRRRWTHWCSYDSLYSPSSCSGVPHCVGVEILNHCIKPPKTGRDSNTLQARMVNLTRTVHREALATHMRRTDAAVWRAAAAVLNLPPGVGEYRADMKGPDKACSTLGWQMMLPLRHGGLGLHKQSDEVSDAAIVAGAGQAERNLCFALCKGLVAPPCGSGGAAFTHCTRSSANGTQQRRTCRRSSWIDRTGCLGRSSS